jgi:hypothetical protein
MSGAPPQGRSPKLKSPPPAGRSHRLTSDGIAVMNRNDNSGLFGMAYGESRPVP